MCYSFSKWVVFGGVKMEGVLGERLRGFCSFRGDLVVAASHVCVL